jgi:hypothetical protein
MKRKIVMIAFVAVLALLLSANLMELAAQCPMCRMSAESNLNNGGTVGRGLNTGILYMLAMPYLIVGCIGIWWYRNRKKDQQVTEMTEADFAA